MIGFGDFERVVAEMMNEISKFCDSICESFLSDIVQLNGVMCELK
jgi:hypothetical protein